MRTAAFAAAAGLGVVGLNQVDQGLQGHHLVHVSEELLTLGELLGGGLLFIPELQLLVAHHSQPRTVITEPLSRVQAGLPRVPSCYHR